MNFYHEIHKNLYKKPDKAFYYLLILAEGWDFLLKLCPVSVAIIRGVIVLHFTCSSSHEPPSQFQSNITQGIIADFKICLYKWPDAETFFQLRDTCNLKKCKMIVSFYKCFFLKNKTTGNTSINTCAYMQVKFRVY